MTFLSRLVLIIVQWFGYLWHFIVFVVLIPAFLFLLSDGLDYLVFRVVLAARWADGIPVSVLPLYNLFAFTLVAFGVLVVVEAAMTLYKEAHTFPFAHLPHAELRPSQLATSGWYARVRHPMLMGYLIILVGLGLMVQSPAMVLWWIPLFGGVTVVKAKFIEERKLQAWFGDEYINYQKVVPALFPRLINRKVKSK